MVTPAGSADFMPTGGAEGVSIPSFEVSQLVEGDTEFFDHIEQSLEMVEMVLDSLSSDTDTPEVIKQEGKIDVKEGLKEIHNRIMEVDIEQQETRNKVDELKHTLSQLEKTINDEDDVGESSLTSRKVEQIKPEETVVVHSGKERGEDPEILHTKLQAKKMQLENLRGKADSKIKELKEEREGLLEEYRDLENKRPLAEQQIVTFKRILEKKDRTDLSKLKITKEHIKPLEKFESQIGNNPSETVKELILLSKLYEQPLKDGIRESVDFVVTSDELKELEQAGISFRK